MKARLKLRITLASMAACLIGTLCYFLFVSPHRGGSESAQIANLSAEYQSDAIVIEGFRQTVAEGTKTIYDLWAQTATLKVEAREYTLEGVLPASTYFGEGDRRISFSADGGIYDPSSDNAILRGNVMAMLSTGLTLRCEEIKFSRSAMTASSESIVVIAGEGLHFHSKGFLVDLHTKEIFFPSVVHIESESSPAQLMRLFADDDKMSSSLDALEDGFMLTASQMLVRTKERTADLSGDVTLKLGENELFAEELHFGWKEKVQEIEWGEMGGFVVAKTPDGAMGCDLAEYRDARLVLRGDPLLIRDFVRLDRVGKGYSTADDQRQWPALMSSLMDGSREYGRTLLYGTREKFTVLRSAARYLGCTTLSGEEMIYTKSPEQFLIRDNVALTLCDMPGIAVEASGATLKVVAELLVFDMKTKRALFTGDIHVLSNENSISASTLAVKMRDSSDGGIEVESLDFDGLVEARIWAPDSSSESSQDGGPRLVELHADRLSIDANAGEVQCSGNVSIHSEDRSLSCQELKMTLLKGMTGIKQLVAREHVVLEGQGRMATGGKLVFNGEREVAELTRQPKVWYGDNVILGRKVAYNLKTGNLSVIDRARGVFYNEEELEVEGIDEGAEDGNTGGRSALSLSESIRRPGMVELSADRLDYNENTMEGSYSGNVVIRKGDAVFSADSVKMKGNVTSGEITSLEAVGNVRVQDGARVLLAERAVYYDDEQKVMLFGNPKVYEFGKMITRGAVVTLYLGRKEYEIKGEEDAKIKTTLFIPEED